MKTRLSFLVLVGFLTACVPCRALPPQSPSASREAHGDFGAALALAREHHKQALVIFTGLEWEEWSRRLDAEVLSRPEFRSAAADEFVITRVDLPRAPRPAAELSEREARDYALAGEFRLGVFPSIYLCTAEGRPYALVGYREGGPEALLAEIRAKRDAHARRMAAIDALHGPEKARALDAWLETLPEPLRTLHADRIDALIAADPDDVTGLRAKYRIALTLPEARRLRYAGELEGAEKLYRGLIAELGATGERLQDLHYELADVYFQRKDYDALLDTLDRAIAAAPESRRRVVLDEMMDVFTRQWIWTRYDRDAMAAAGHDHKSMRLAPDGVARFAKLIVAAKTVAPSSSRQRVLDQMLAETKARSESATERQSYGTTADGATEQAARSEGAPDRVGAGR